MINMKNAYTYKQNAYFVNEHTESFQKYVSNVYC